MNVSFALYDAAMPRTVYYDLFAAAVRRNPRYIANESEADLCLPAEDIALEANWPRYGDPANAFVRGSFNRDRLNAYAETFTALRRPICVPNMYPYVRWPQLSASYGHILVADISLAGYERLLNPRTVSMPALPIVAGPGIAGSKSVLASFRGIASHPCREKLRAIHDGTMIRCEIADPAAYVGRIDATTGARDDSYAELMAASIFAFVPRGDALFSYRLLKAMSFGCIPVVLSDNWVLPFDRTIVWSEIAMHFAEKDISALPGILRAFSPERIAAIQRRIGTVYDRYFSSLDAIVETLFREIEMVMDEHPNRP